jgi:uncharacterized protein (DUF433 family)
LGSVKFFVTVQGLLIWDFGDLLERIVLNPKVMVGKPVIRGTRLPVEYILNLLAHGAKENKILDEYKGLNTEDIQACILFATKSLENTDFKNSNIIPPSGELPGSAARCIYRCN